MYYVFVLLLLLSCCHNGTIKSVATNPAISKPVADSAYYHNIIYDRKFGDSLHVIYEKKGDTIIKHYLDLTGLERHHFDDSYTATCYYKKCVNDTTIKADLSVKLGDYTVSFNKQNIITACDSVIRNSSGADKDDFVQIKKYVVDTDKKNKPNVALEFWGSNAPQIILLSHFPGKIINTKTLEKPTSILIEFYTTEFSGGENLSAVQNNGDTVEVYHNMEYIR